MPLALKATMGSLMKGLRAFLRWCGFSFFGLVEPALDAATTLGRGRS